MQNHAGGFNVSYVQYSYVDMEQRPLVLVGEKHIIN